VSAELRKLVREVAAEHPGSPPSEVARFVAKLTADEHLRDFYAEAMTGYVAEVLGQHRRDSMDKALNKNHAGSNKSPKLEARRKHFEQMMSERVKGRDGWKLVGDCTIDDLRYCIQERITQIQRTQHQISNYELLINLMQQYNVTVAKQLVGVVK
jgi:hypothetical protein